MLMFLYFIHFCPFIFDFHKKKKNEYDWKKWRANFESKVVLFFKSFIEDAADIYSTRYENLHSKYLAEKRNLCVSFFLGAFDEITCSFSNWKVKLQINPDGPYLLSLILQWAD